MGRLKAWSSGREKRKGFIEGRSLVNMYCYGQRPYNGIPIHNQQQQSPTNDNKYQGYSLSVLYADKVTTTILYLLNNTMCWHLNSGINLIYYVLEGKLPLIEDYWRRVL